jgi:hypothetical protein
MKKASDIKVNYATHKKWASRAGALNSLPALICFAGIFLFFAIDFPLLILSCMIGSFILSPFMYFPFYLNGKIAVTAAGLRLIRGKEEELLPWEAIEKMDLRIIDLDTEKNYVELTVLLKNKETKQVFFTRCLLEGKIKRMTRFLHQCILVPDAERRLDPKVVAEFRKAKGLL